MKTSLSTSVVQQITTVLAQSNRAFADQYPGNEGKRNPVHVLYGGAHLFKSDSASKLGSIARNFLSEYAPDSASFAEIFGLIGNEEDHSKIYTRVVSKLSKEPIEDYRIDFEDGYGVRTNEEEDQQAVATAAEVAKGVLDGTLPPFIGIRIKPFDDRFKKRAIRTLDLFITELTSQTLRRLPDNFVITLPKVTTPEQVSALSEVLGLLERQCGLQPGAISIELMVETPQAIINDEGMVNLPRLVAASRGRCISAHFGAYDYTAKCGIISSSQHLHHSACDFARNMMQVSLSGLGIRLSDGATNILPIPPHKASNGELLTEEQRESNRNTVHNAWSIHYGSIRYSLHNGFYQGWDLHPAQLIPRYAAMYSFFHEGVAHAAERLRNFIDESERATLVGDVFDDAATGQGLRNYFVSAVNCGAIDEDDVEGLIGMSLKELLSPRQNVSAKIV